MHVQKVLVFRGDAKKRFAAFPEEVQDVAGYEFFLIQCGRQPSDFYAMPSIGPCVEELTIPDQRKSAFRGIDIPQFVCEVFVLHTFHTDTTHTDSNDSNPSRP